MKLDQLVATIRSVHNATRVQAANSVNRALTTRNWLIGHYIVEFEQKGDDRAKYGIGLMETLSSKLRGDGIQGMSPTALRKFREFYNAYPQIQQTVSVELDSLPSKVAAPQKKPSIQQTLSVELLVDPRLLVERLSFSHFVELLKVEHALKRTFYESRAIKENWSVRELKRQIETLLFERMAKSKSKDKAEVKFATAGLANKLFVSRYKLQLPTENELRKFIKQDVKAFGERKVNIYG